MIQRKKILFSVFTLLGLLLFSSHVLFAQPLPDDPGCFPPPCIPIDGGIGFLVAAGIAFGVKKTADLRARKKE